MSLDAVCTVAYAIAALPATGFLDGITIHPSSVTASPIYNASISDQYMFPDGQISFCNVTLAYSHDGLNDTVLNNYWLPSPSSYQNRWLTTGGGGLAINSGVTTSGSLPGGVLYGAAAGLTDGGFGGFSEEFDAGFLLANGTINWPQVYSFGYTALHELTVLGKEFTKQFYNATAATKQYSYYQACSEGGREGFSQVQRYDEFDGAIIGAPAIRYGFQQVNHLTSNIIEQTLGYFPPPCELEKIMNLTIAACDPLDGKVDGVVSRNDLCSLSYNISSTLGQPYYCEASMGGFMSAATPAQNGTVSAAAVEVAQAIIAGLFDSNGDRVYFSYTPSSTYTDAQTQYNSTDGTWNLDPDGLGGEWIARFLMLQDTSELPDIYNFSSITYDNLKYWMLEGTQRYGDSLQTDWPDLTQFQESGGKVLHYHGESDYSIPTASSVRYHESVREIMYPDMSFNESSAALNEWYSLYLVPGGSHCAPNSYEPNGPWPQTNLAVMIDWVERNNTPTTLNATILQGEHIGENQQICRWPLRPLWSSNGTQLDCVYDQQSIDTWTFDLDAIKLPIY